FRRQRFGLAIDSSRLLQRREQLRVAPPGGVHRSQDELGRVGFEFAVADHGRQFRGTVPFSQPSADGQANQLVAVGSVVERRREQLLGGTWTRIRQGR